MKKLISNKNKAPELHYYEVDEDGEYRIFGGCPTVNALPLTIDKSGK